ncbi:MAG: hypothetical protein P8J33_17660, partial [Pirellulaceae bacterium]|nr:hypothetical protein [Pirellulaceae bacterium]
RLDSRSNQQRGWQRHFARGFAGPANFGETEILDGKPVTLASPSMRKRRPVEAAFSYQMRMQFPDVLIDE